MWRGSLVQLEDTVLDLVTLAYFDAAGWYKVNYDVAGNFVWGRGWWSSTAAD
jgi:hypothetical protein